MPHRRHPPESPAPADPSPARPAETPTAPRGKSRRPAAETPAPAWRRQRPVAETPAPSWGKVPPTQRPLAQKPHGPEPVPRDTSRLSRSRILGDADRLFRSVSGRARQLRNGCTERCDSGYRGNQPRGRNSRSSPKAHHQGYRISAGENRAVVTDLINTEKVVALIGEITTDRSLVAATLAQPTGIPMITPSATGEKVTGNGRLSSSAHASRIPSKPRYGQIRALARRKEASRFFLTLQTRTSTGLMEAFKAIFRSTVARSSRRSSITWGDTDFAAQLNAIKDKNPEIIFLPSYYGEAALIIRQARQMGIDAPFLGTDGWEATGLSKSAGRRPTIATLLPTSQTNRPPTKQRRSATPIRKVSGCAVWHSLP